MTTPWAQGGSDLRFDWGPRGAAELVAGGVRAVVVVDVLSFTTTVGVAVERGTRVRPHRWDPASAQVLAQRLDAVCAVGRAAAGPGEVSLSPASILAAEPVERLVLPSPNGSAICAELEGAGVAVAAGSLRNATAAGRWLAGRPEPVGVVAAGERWRADRSLRPAVEDLWGAGLVVEAVARSRPGAVPSPEADAARAASAVVRGDPLGQLLGCASGVELAEKGFARDVEVAAGLDRSVVVPVLTDGWFVAAG